MKLTIRLVLAGLVAALVLSACGGGTATPAGGGGLGGDAAAGATKFAGTCASCHGPDAKGLPGLGKDLTTSEFVKSQSDAELVAFIKVGRPISDPANTTGVDMPPKGGNPALSDQDLADIVAHIRSISQ
jgi:disulfide bond formation protein DsbB